MALTGSDVEALMKGITPALQKILEERDKLFADMITDQRKTIVRLEQRVADLEEQATKP